MLEQVSGGCTLRQSDPTLPFEPHLLSCAFNFRAMVEHPEADFDLSQLASVSHPVEGSVTNHEPFQRLRCAHEFAVLAVSGGTEG